MANDDDGDIWSALRQQASAIPLPEDESPDELPQPTKAGTTDLVAHLSAHPEDQPAIEAGYKAIMSHPANGPQGKMTDVSHTDLGQAYREIVGNSIPQAGKTRVLADGNTFHVGVSDKDGEPILALSRSKLPDGTIQMHDAFVSPEYSGQGLFSSLQRQELPMLARSNPGKPLSASAGNPILHEDTRDTLRGVMMSDGSFHGKLPDDSEDFDSPQDNNSGLSLESLKSMTGNGPRPTVHSAGQTMGSGG